MDCLTFRKNINAYIGKSLPDDELNAFLQHLSSCEKCREELEINYIVSEGIGLRQLCDIFMYLHRWHDEIDATRLDRWLDALRLRHLADAIATTSDTMPSSSSSQVFSGLV